MYLPFLTLNFCRFKFTRAIGLGSDSGFSYAISSFGYFTYCCQPGYQLRSLQNTKIKGPRYGSVFCFLECHNRWFMGHCYRHTINFYYYYDYAVRVRMDTITVNQQYSMQLRGQKDQARQAYLNYHAHFIISLAFLLLAASCISSEDRYGVLSICNWAMCLR